MRPIWRQGDSIDIREETGVTTVNEKRLSCSGIPHIDFCAIPSRGNAAPIGRPHHIVHRWSETHSGKLPAMAAIRLQILPVSASQTRTVPSPPAEAMRV